MRRDGGTEGKKEKGREEWRDGERFSQQSGFLEEDVLLLKGRPRRLRCVIMKVRATYLSECRGGEGVLGVCWV